MKYALHAAAMATAVVLSGCSGEPSQDAVEGALRKNIEQSNESAKQLMGKSPPADLLTKLNSARKIGCSKESDKTYRCDVEVDLTAPLIGTVKKTTPVRLVNGSEGWVVSQ